MLRQMFTAFKLWLRPTPSVHEVHRRYQDHLREDGSCNLQAARLTEIEYNALLWVLQCSPDANSGVYELERAARTWWSNHQLFIDFSGQEEELHQRVVKLLNMWARQQEASQYRLAMDGDTPFPYATTMRMW